QNGGSQGRDGAGVQGSLNLCNIPEQLMKNYLENGTEVPAPLVSRRTFMLAAAATGGAGIVSSSVGLALMGARRSANRIDRRWSQMESPIEVVRRFCAAWNADVGAAELAAFFTDDAVYHNIPLAPVTGRAAIANNFASFIRPSAPGSARQPARFDQCEKRDDPGRHLRLAQRGQPGAQALSALDRDEHRARSHRPRFRTDWAGVGDEGVRGPRRHSPGRQGRDVRLVHVSRAPVRPGNPFAVLAPREGERRKTSLRPVSRG